MRVLPEASDASGSTFLDAPQTHPQHAVFAENRPTSETTLSTYVHNSAISVEPDESYAVTVFRLPRGSCLQARVNFQSNRVIRHTSNTSRPERSIGRAHQQLNTSRPASNVNSALKPFQADCAPSPTPFPWAKDAHHRSTRNSTTQKTKSSKYKSQSCTQKGEKKAVPVRTVCLQKLVLTPPHNYGLTKMFHLSPCNSSSFDCLGLPIWPPWVLLPFAVPSLPGVLVCLPLVEGVSVNTTCTGNSLCLWPSPTVPPGNCHGCAQSARNASTSR